MRRHRARYPRAVSSPPALPAAPALPAPFRRVAGGIALVLSLGAAVALAVTMLGGG
jgi:hypothetical protein